MPTVLLYSSIEKSAKAFTALNQLTKEQKSSGRIKKTK